MTIACGMKRGGVSQGKKLRNREKGERLGGSRVEVGRLVLKTQVGNKEL